MARAGRLELREPLPKGAWQRCCVHFLRNAFDYRARKVCEDCLQELRWIGAGPRARLRPDLGDRGDLAEVRRESPNGSPNTQVEATLKV